MKKLIPAILLLALIFLLPLPQVQAAKVYGNVYGPGLDLLKNAVVSVNSTPQQTLVAADGAYSFELAPGAYTIESVYKEGPFYTKEEIKIESEGSYVLDLILFDIPEFNDIDFNDSDITLIENLFKDKEKPESKLNEILVAVATIVIVIAIGVAYFIYKYKKLRKKKEIKKKTKTRQKQKEKNEKIFSPDETLNKVISFIKKEKRTTQKDARKQLGMSEAKISLLITDLEDRKLVRKIKKGRGNIIIWQGE